MHNNVKRCTDAPGGGQLTALHLSSPKCPEHTATGLMIQLQSQSLTCDLGCPGAPMDILMLEHVVRYGQTGTSSQAPTPGLAPGRGPGNPLGREYVLCFFFNIRVF